MKRRKRMERSMGRRLGGRRERAVGAQTTRRAQDIVRSPVRGLGERRLPQKPSIIPHLGVL